MMGYYKLSNGNTGHYFIEDIYFDSNIGMTIFEGRSLHGNVVRLSSREILFSSSN